LKQGVRDPKRKAYLVAKLLKVESEISALGFSKEEIERNNFGYAGAETKLAVGNQVLITPPQSVDALKQDQKQAEEV
jgi:hypothetical protein